MNKVRTKSKTDLETMLSSFRVEGIIIPEAEAKQIAKKVEEKLRKKKQS